LGDIKIILLANTGKWQTVLDDNLLTSCTLENKSFVLSKIEHVGGGSLPFTDMPLMKLLKHLSNCPFYKIDNRKLQHPKALGTNINLMAKGKKEEQNYFISRCKFQTHLLSAPTRHW
jgi:hypothetical protein